MIIRCIALIFLLHAVEAVAASYPVDIVKGFIITTAEIDGQTVNVILDSGAPGVVLNEKYYSGEKQKDIQCTGLNGSFLCGVRTIRSWKWLGAERGKTKALVSDLAFLESATSRPIYALVGLSVLDDYYVSIDIDNETVTLLSTIPEKWESSLTRINFVDHLPVISCTVNGQKKILGLDTGSASNYLFSFAPKDGSFSQLEATPVIVVGTDNREDLRHRVMLNVHVSDQDAPFSSSFIVDLTDKGAFQHDGFDGILGQEFLSQYNLIIHPGKQKMLLLPRVQEDVVLE